MKFKDNFIRVVKYGSWWYCVKKLCFSVVICCGDSMDPTLKDGGKESFHLFFHHLFHLFNLLSSIELNGRHNFSQQILVESKFLWPGIDQVRDAVCTDEVIIESQSEIVSWSWIHHSIHRQFCARESAQHRMNPWCQKVVFMSWVTTVRRVMTQETLVLYR